LAEENLSEFLPIQEAPLPPLPKPVAETEKPALPEDGEPTESMASDTEEPKLPMEAAGEVESGEGVEEALDGAIVEDGTINLETPMPPSPSELSRGEDSLIDRDFSDPLPPGVQAPEIQTAIQTAQATQVSAASLVDVDSMNYHEPGYSRFYAGYFLTPQVFAINNVFSFFADWNLSFIPAESATYRKPKFGLLHQHIQSITLTLVNGETEIQACAEDYRENKTMVPCLIPAVLGTENLVARLVVVTAEGLTYHLQIPLTEGLTAVYSGRLSVDKLARIKLSHHPFRVTYLAARNWFAFISPLNDRFFLEFDFTDQKVILNVSSDQLFPNHMNVAPFREEAFNLPFGFPFRPHIIHPRTNVDLTLRFYVDVGLKYLVATEAGIRGAPLFPGFDARVLMHLRDFDWVALHMGLEKTLFNSLSSSFFGLSTFDARVQGQYQFKAAFLRPKPIFGIGYFEMVLQDSSARVTTFRPVLLSYVSGINLYLGLNVTLVRGLELDLGALYALVTVPARVNMFVRPEAGLSYFFTPNLAIQLQWKAHWYERTPAAAAKRAGSVQDMGLFVRYNI
jgi:hypothetical protein